MFTRPKNGWTEIHLEDFEGLGSYIQDIPVMVLDRGVQSVQERTPLKLWFDEEEKQKSSQRVNSVRRNTILSVLSWI